MRSVLLLLFLPFTKECDPETHTKIEKVQNAILITELFTYIRYSNLYLHQNITPNTMSPPQTPLTQPDKKASYLNLPRKGQLAIQCLARIADPLAISSIQVCTEAFDEREKLSILSVIYVLPVAILRSTRLQCYYFYASWHPCWRQNGCSSVHRYDLGSTG